MTAQDSTEAQHDPMPGEPGSVMEDRDAIYRRLAKEAAKQIASWPRWMQRNLAPTKQQPGEVEHGLEYEQGLKAGYVQGLADAAGIGAHTAFLEGAAAALGHQFDRAVSDLRGETRDHPDHSFREAVVPDVEALARAIIADRTGQRSPRNDEPDRCPMCDGTGRQQYRGEDKACPTCGGSGDFRVGYRLRNDEPEPQS
jgi:hypothetical protein